MPNAPAVASSPLSQNALPVQQSAAQMPPKQIQELIAQLEPPIEPGPISIWPLAPAWWLLILLIIVSVVAASLQLTRSWKRGIYQRRALAELAAIPESESAAYVAQISCLIKRLIIARCPQARLSIGRIRGEQLIQILNESCDKPVFSGQIAEALIQAQYSKNLAFKPAELNQQARIWIKRHSKRKLTAFLNSTHNLNPHKSMPGGLKHV